MRVDARFSLQAMARPAQVAGGGEVFRLPSFQTTAGVAAAAAAGLPMRGVEARRRRALRAGHGLVDGLEALKLGLLQGAGGEAETRALQRRLDALEDDGSGDAGLDDLLEAVRLRVEVELAKRSAQNARPVHSL